MTNANDVIARFRTQLDTVRPATGGVSADTIEAEVVALMPLLIEISIDERAGEEFESFSFREVLTVVTLLGRRLALLDLTPTSAVTIVDAALDATRGDGVPPTPAFDRHARGAALAGFVRGREERERAECDTRNQLPVAPLRIDGSSFALVVSGVHEPEVLGEYVDALGRAILDANASVGIVELSQLGEPNRDRARAIFAAEEVVRMLGGRCIFSGVDSRWEAAAQDAHIDLSMLHVTSTFSEALQATRVATSEAKSRPPFAWRALFERLRR